MEWYFALAFLLSLILIFMAIGTPIALAFLAANPGATATWAATGSTPPPFAT